MVVRKWFCRHKVSIAINKSPPLKGDLGGCYSSENQNFIKNLTFGNRIMRIHPPSLSGHPPSKGDSCCRLATNYFFWQHLSKIRPNRVFSRILFDQSLLRNNSQQFFICRIFIQKFDKRVSRFKITSSCQSFSNSSNFSAGLSAQKQLFFSCTAGV